MSEKFLPPSSYKLGFLFIGLEHISRKQGHTALHSLTGLQRRTHEWFNVSSVNIAMPPGGQ